jgi:hypothetical protein
MIVAYGVYRMIGGLIANSKPGFDQVTQDDSQ